MSTLLLSLLLIALVAIGLLMASTKVRESFVNAPSAAPSIVASPVMASLLATPNLSTGSPQVNTIGRDGDLQTATDAGSQTQPGTSYSAVGPASSTLTGAFSELTPAEANFIRSLREARNKQFNRNEPLDGPLDDNTMRLQINTFRIANDMAMKNIDKGDFSSPGPNQLTLEELKAITDRYKAAGKEMTAFTESDRSLISDMRRTWADAKKGGGVIMPITGPSTITGPSPMRGPAGPSPIAGSIESRMALNEEEMSALTSVRKEEAKRKARLLLLQDQENKRKTQEISNSRSNNNRSNKRDEDYEDDYGVMDGRRRRERHERHEICPECEQCPDMSQYVKLDEIPCWNCSLP